MKFLIGRGLNCDLVVNHACVSKPHASLTREAVYALVLRDEDSTNGTFINSLQNEVKEIELRDDDVVFLSPDYKVPGSLLVSKFLAWEQSGGTARSALALGGVYRFTTDVISLGSAPENDVVLPYLGVWPEHARLVRDESGILCLEDLGGGCVVNGDEILEDVVPLAPNASMVIGGVLISVSYDPAGRAVTIGCDRRGFYLTVHNLNYVVYPGGRPLTLLHNVNFSVLPGEFVGLLGPSGSGKTTLLDCLSGSNIAEGVFFNGQPLGEAAAACANLIGYVPQDDLLYPELTVRETLFWSARLRLDFRTTDERIYAKIDEVCAMLGLEGQRDTLVGSPQRKTLSGGQKKRVNLALELLTDPLILFLDEPTSGLSSRDTRVVMECLRKIADDKGISIIMTIHQPSPKIYQMFDQTLYLQAGRMAWFGPAAPHSIRHFLGEQADKAGPDEIMEVVDEGEGEVLEERYQHGRYFHKFVEEREKLVISLTDGGDLAVPVTLEPLGRAGQFWHLLKRQLVRRWRDRAALMILIGQGPLLGGLLAAAFYHTRLNTPLFLLAFIAVWFGATVTSRELVTERMMLKREKRGGVSALAVLLAKTANHGLLLLVQCFFMFEVAVRLLGSQMSVWVALPVLWLCGLFGMMLGFVISALSKSELAAAAATPLVLIPIILFGGYLNPYGDMDKEWVGKDGVTQLKPNPNPVGVVAKAISQVMPTRWGYEALVHSENLSRSDDDVFLWETADRDFLEFDKNKDKGISDKERSPKIKRSFLALIAGSLALGIVAWRLLRRI